MLLGPTVEGDIAWLAGQPVGASSQLGIHKMADIRNRKVVGRECRVAEVVAH